MNLSKFISDIQKRWKVLMAFGIWIGTIAGSFILPMPIWAVDDSINQEYTNFGNLLTITTVITGGFCFFCVFKYSAAKYYKKWMYASIISLILFIVSFSTYYYMRTEYTLPWDKENVVIGTVFKPNAPEIWKALESQYGFEIPETQILDYVGGNAYIIWEREGIRRHTAMLMIMLVTTYSVFSLFIVLFTNFILVSTTSKKKNGRKKP